MPRASRKMPRLLCLAHKARVIQVTINSISVRAGSRQNNVFTAITTVNALTYSCSRAKIAPSMASVSDSWGMVIFKKCISLTFMCLNFAASFQTQWLPCWRCILYDWNCLVKQIIKLWDLSFANRPNAGLSLLFGPSELALLDRSLPRFTCQRLSTSHVRYSLKVMLHGAIRNDDFSSTQRCNVGTLL